MKRTVLRVARLPLSKSILNRLLILNSLSPRQIRLGEISDADDVVDLHRALCALRAGRTDFRVRSGGTALRFLAARLSRIPGRWCVEVSERLISRPHRELWELLGQMGVLIRQTANAFEIHSPAGWTRPSGGEVDLSSGLSSQYATAVLLAAIGLPFPLRFRWTEMASSPYLEMTLSLLKDWYGVEAQVDGRGFSLDLPADLAPKRQGVAVVEADLSSAFSIAAWALKTGGVRLPGCGDLRSSLQPDARFAEILRSMGATLSAEGEDLLVLPLERRPLPIRVDISRSPDLFPVLCALAATADGRSEIVGGEHLRAKESDRLAVTQRLLVAAGVSCGPIEGGGLWIDGTESRPTEPFDFDPDRDHRMAFAAEVLNANGWRIRVTDESVVEKSYPLYYADTRSRRDLKRSIAYIGQRGVGKSEVARALGQLGRHAAIEDLDASIERATGRSIASWFQESGEATFRQVERDAFARQTSTPGLGLSVGGGFDVAQIPSSWDAVWVRRRGDRSGRLFLDRPRLDPELDPLAESQSRAQDREPRFQARADEVLWLTEDSPHVRNQGLRASVNLTGWTTTLSQARATRGAVFLSRLFHEMADRRLEVELRDDLLTVEQMQAAIRAARQERVRVLISIRSGVGWAPLRSWLSDEGLRARIDFDVSWLSELSQIELDEARAISRICEVWISYHGEDWRQFLKEARFSGISKRQKLAPQVLSFASLLEGERWRKEEPESRAFCPISNDGRWLWYRLIRPGPLAFLADDEASAVDQPTIGEVVRAHGAEWVDEIRRGPAEFAAVLGSNVGLSWSPSEHQRFFWSQVRMPYVPVKIEREEWAEALPALEEIGLRAASVTAPHKFNAGQLCQGRERESTNTLWRRADGQWQGESTDEAGCRRAWLRACDQHDPSKLWRHVAIWGGGGVLPSLRAALKGYQVSEWSARTAEPRTVVSGEAPDVVVWAADSSQMQAPWPESWRPKLVWDLSYREDSRARSWAAQLGSSYINGAEFFVEQARLQQEFWLKEVIS